MFKKILVPLDGSETAERALAFAQKLTSQENGQHELILLRVPVAEDAFIDGHIADVYPKQPLDNTAAEEAQTYLNQLKQQFESTDLIVQTLTTVGDIAGVILDTAVAEEIDLLIMSTHGRSALRLWMLGGVAERVLRNASCPVLSVRTDQPLNEIVITLDGSPLAERILPIVFPLARVLEAQVTLLTVNGVIAKSATIDYLQRIIAQYDAAAFANFKILSGKAAPAIVDYVANNDVDLLAMVTHGYTGS
ncbi:MAG: universal stress protein, partial [Anaerolineales bacterium]|nr:universal stress protein [Anaerolineales bacterium]